MTTYTPDGEFEFHVLIDDKLYTECPIIGHREKYCQLKKTLGHQTYSVHNFAITPSKYGPTICVVGMGATNVFDAGITRLNTRAGDFTNCEVQNTPSR